MPNFGGDKTYFIFLYTPGGSWRTGKSILKQSLDEHFAYMTELKDSGVRKLGGAFTDNAGAMEILEMETLEQAKTIILADPAVMSGIFDASVHT